MTYHPIMMEVFGVSSPSNLFKTFLALEVEKPLFQEDNPPFW